MVEIIPKPTEKVSVWQNLPFYLSFFLLLMVVFSYFILEIYLDRAKNTLKSLQETLAKEKTAEEIALEEKILSHQKKIEDFSKLINQHLFSSKFFQFIEKNSHPQVWFFGLELKPKRGEVKLSAEAENFLALAQQLQILRANPSVKNLDLVKIEIGKEGRVNLVFTLHLDPNLFKWVD